MLDLSYEHMGPIYSRVRYGIDRPDRLDRPDITTYFIREKNKVVLHFISTDTFQTIKNISFESSYRFCNSKSTYSDKSNLFCLAGYDISILFDPKLDQEARKLSQKIINCDFRPDGKRLVCISTDITVETIEHIEGNKIQIWDTDSDSKTFGQCINEKLLHRPGIVEGMNILEYIECIQHFEESNEEVIKRQTRPFPRAHLGVFSNISYGKTLPPAPAMVDLYDFGG